MVSRLKKCHQNVKHYEPLQISSWFCRRREPRSQCCHYQGACLSIKPWITIQASLCPPKLTPNSEDTEFGSQVTTLLPMGDWFFSPWGMLTDWRGLHLAVCIFFHIFQHRFKWSHVWSEREEGQLRKPIQAQGTLGVYGGPVCEMVFSLWSHSQGLTKPLLTACKLVWKVFKTQSLTWSNDLPHQIKITKRPLEVGGMRVWGFLLTTGTWDPTPTSRSPDAWLLHR